MIDIKQLLSDITAASATTQLINELSMSVVEEAFVKSGVTHEKFRKALMAHCEADKSSDALKSSENVALWLLSSDNKQVRNQGATMLNWLQSRSNTNIPASVMYNQAIEKLTGHTVPRDELGATALLRKCLAKETEKTRLRSMIVNTLADSYRLGRCVERDIDKAISYYVEAAELGCPEAAYNAGLYFDGKLEQRGTPIDRNMAAHYYVIAMNGGFLLAQTNLGVLHMCKQITNADPAYGKTLLLSSAAEGDAIAASSLEMIEAQLATMEREGKAHQDRSPTANSPISTTSAPQEEASDTERAWFKSIPQVIDPLLIRILEAVGEDRPKQAFVSENMTEEQIGLFMAELPDEFARRMVSSAVSVLLENSMKSGELSEDEFIELLDEARTHQGRLDILERSYQATPPQRRRRHP